MLNYKYGYLYCYLYCSLGQFPKKTELSRLLTQNLYRPDALNVALPPPT